MGDFAPVLTQLLVAAIITFVCVCIQTVSNIALLFWVLHELKRLGLKHWVVWSVSVIVRLIFAFIGIHLAQLGVWTLSYLLLGCFARVEEALFFSIASFSTAEHGDTALPREWRLLGPLEGFNGIIAFGLSIGFMYTVINRMLEDRMRRMQEAERQANK
ncbi:MAG: hypothetical protein H7Y32_06850 [Chloroflexales bacterium]|nr:hypothetical protein [Chloroflexales bacterium]